MCLKKNTHRRTNCTKRILLGGVSQYLFNIEEGLTNIVLCKVFNNFASLNKSLERTKILLLVISQPQTVKGIQRLFHES